MNKGSTGRDHQSQVTYSTYGSHADRLYHRGLTYKESQDLSYDCVKSCLKTVVRLGVKIL